jgi:phage-related minor tail protein
MTTLYEELGETIPSTFDGVELGVTETMSKVADSAEKNVNKMNESFNKLPKTVTSVFREVQRTVQESVRSLQSVMNFQWSIPRPKIPRITWTYNSVQYGGGNSVRIPQFDVRWFAKGGVLNNPTLFGMGDAGAEALVPLERNTQWISKVAREMNRQGASTSAASDDVSVIIYTAAAQIVQAINDSANRKGNVSVNVNGREFFRATYDDQKAVARERGVSLVVG